MQVNTYFKEMLQSESIAEIWGSSVVSEAGVFPGELRQEPILYSKAKEQMAVNLPGFFGLVGGLGFFIQTGNRSPFEVLNAIQTKNLSGKERELFCRFANCTWKVSQPFRDLQRITRANFVPFSMLSHREQEKDMVQIETAADFVLKSASGWEQWSPDEQWHWIGKLREDSTFLEGMAKTLFEAYYLDIAEAPPVFLKEADWEQTIERSSRQEVLAKSLSVLYVLECFCDGQLLESLSALNLLLAQIQQHNLPEDKKALLIYLLQAARDTTTVFTSEDMHALLTNKTISPGGEEADLFPERLLSYSAGKLQEYLSRSF